MYDYIIEMYTHFNADFSFRKKKKKDIVQVSLLEEIHLFLLNKIYQSYDIHPHRFLWYIGNKT
jgi:hypothetical protein